MPIATEAEVAREFQSVKDPQLLERCLKICHAHNVSASEAATQWDLLQVNAGAGKMTLESVGKLEAKVNEFATKKRQKTACDPRTGGHTQVLPRSGHVSTFSKDTAHLLQLGGLGVPRRSWVPLGRARARHGDILGGEGRVAVPEGGRWHPQVARRRSARR